MTGWDILGQTTPGTALAGGTAGVCVAWVAETAGIVVGPELATVGGALLTLAISWISKRVRAKLAESTAAAAAELEAKPED